MNKVTRPLPNGKQITVMDLSPSAGGSHTETFAIDADTLLISLFAVSVSGTLDVSVETFTDDNKSVEIIQFPQLNSATSNLLLRRAAVSMQNVRITATYSAAAEFEIRARGLATGETSVRILGANTGRAAQIDIDTTSQVLVPSALTDRTGIVIKNNNSSGILYLGYSASEATVADGYPVGPGESIGMDVSAGAEIYARASTGTIDVRLMEAST